MDHLRRQQLEDALATRILVLDGAMGSILQARLRVEDYGGAHLENCTDNVSRANPGVVYAVHTSYLAAGADIIETNSFNGHPVSLAEFQLGDRRLRHQPRRGGARPDRRGRVFRVWAANAGSPARWGRRPDRSPSPGTSTFEPCARATISRRAR